jgi:regulator of protease activity HflC (stomatin/prohibitin superfamily)
MTINETPSRGITPLKVITLGLTAAVTIGFFVSVGQLWENLDASEIMVVQSPISGELTWHTSPGIKWQGLGRVTKYPRRALYAINQKVRFNDGGHADMSGSIQYDMPLDEKNLTEIHLKFHSAVAVAKQLIETVVNKAVYMTGPLMSSKESYSEKRNSLIHYVEDQVERGVYQTVQREVQIADPITGDKKTATVVEITMGKDGLPLRQEASVLGSFGIKSFNFSISAIDYEQAVEAQIKQQQQITMDVQTAIAGAKKAEQRAITVAKEGEADAAKAKWEQEVIKAKAVTEAQQQLEVAQLDTKRAEQEKLAKILRAEGESEYKRKVMVADGALEQKLAAYKEVQGYWADAIAKYQGAWVPTTIMGTPAGGANGATGLMELLTAKTARDLSLDMSVSGAGATAKK